MFSMIMIVIMITRKILMIISIIMMERSRMERRRISVQFVVDLICGDRFVSATNHTS